MFNRIRNFYTYTSPHFVPGSFKAPDESEMLKFNAEDAIVSESEKEREELKSEEEKKAKIAAELFDSALALLRSGHQ